MSVSSSKQGTVGLGPVKGNAEVGEVFYSNTDYLEWNKAPGGLKHVSVYKDHVWGVGEGNQVYYAQFQDLD